MPKKVCEMIPQMFRVVKEMHRQLIITNRHFTRLSSKDGPPPLTSAVTRYLPIKSNEGAKAVVSTELMKEQMSNYLHSFMPVDMEDASKYWREIFHVNYMRKSIWTDKQT
jgi:hypothetical protein